MNSESIKWGILSTGRIASWFAGDFPHVGNGQLAAVCSRNMASAHAFAETYTIPKCFDDYAAMLADPDIDAIYIGTPHTFHFENARDAMLAGKAVLCEKPLTISASEAIELARIQSETGSYLMEAMWTWFLPAIQKAKAWVDEGRIGTIKHISADFGYPVPYAPDQREYDIQVGGGALLEMGIYPVALTWFFMRKHAKQMQVISRKAPNGADADVTATFDFGDAVASIKTSMQCRLGNGATIVGDEGYITIPDFFRADTCSLYKIDDCIEHFEAKRDYRGYCYQAIAVGEDLLAGRSTSSIVSLEDSIAFQQMMDQIKSHF